MTERRVSVRASLRGWSSVEVRSEGFDFGFHKVTLGVDEMRKFDEDWRQRETEMAEDAAGSFAALQNALNVMCSEGGEPPRTASDWTDEEWDEWRMNSEAPWYGPRGDG